MQLLGTARVQEEHRAEGSLAGYLFHGEMMF